MAQTITAVLAKAVGAIAQARAAVSAPGKIVARALLSFALCAAFVLGGVLPAQAAITISASGSNTSTHIPASANPDSCPTVTPYAGSGGWTGTSAAGTLTYTMSAAVTSIRVSYTAINQISSSGGQDRGTFSINGGGTMTISNVCNGTVAGNVVSATAGTGYTDTWITVTSTLPFTTLTVTNTGATSGWVQGNPAEFVVLAAPPNITLSKVTVSGTGSFTFTGNNGWTNSTITTITAGTPVAAPIQSLTAGVATTLTETPVANWAMTGVSCSGLGSGSVTPNLAGGSFTLDAAAMAMGNSVACTVTNTFTPPPADLAITKTDGVSSLLSGASTTYTVRVTNNGPNAVTGARLRDPAATGLTKTSITCSPTPGQCATAPTIAAIQGAGGVTLPALASGQFYEIRIATTVTATSGSVTNAATITAPATITDSDTSNNSASDTDFISSTAPVAPGLTCPAGTAVLDWDTTTWANGALSGSSTVANLGSVGIGVVATGTTFQAWPSGFGGQATPRLNNTLTSGGPAGLYFVQHVLFANNTTSQTNTTFTLPRVVTGVQVRVNDVDILTGSWQDRITVTGFNGATPVSPTYTAGTSNTVSGGSVIGTQLWTDTAAGGEMYATFTAPIDRFVVTYNSGPSAPATPGAEAMSLSDIVFCNPAADLVVSKSDGVTVAGAGGTTTYTLTVTNNGPETVTGAVVKDTVVSGLNCPAANPVTIAGSGVPSGSFTVSNLTGTGITLGTLAATQSATLTFTCSVL